VPSHLSLAGAKSAPIKVLLLRFRGAPRCLVFLFSFCARAGHAPNAADQAVLGILGSLKVSSIGSSSVLFARQDSGGILQLRINYQKQNMLRGKDTLECHYEGLQNHSPAES